VDVIDAVYLLAKRKMKVSAIIYYVQ